VTKEYAKRSAGCSWRLALSFSAGKFAGLTQRICNQHSHTAKVWIETDPDFFLQVYTTMSMFSVFRPATVAPHLPSLCQHSGLYPHHLGLGLFWCKGDYVPIDVRVDPSYSPRCSCSARQGGPSDEVTFNYIETQHPGVICTFSDASKINHSGTAF
jgi:hypothetical protein